MAFRRFEKKNVRLTFLSIFLLVLIVGGCTARQVVQSKPEMIIPKPDPIEAEWGIKIEGIRRSAAGYMLDFRYRVIDPEKSMPLLSRRIKSYAIEQESGLQLPVPVMAKLGSFRQTTLKPEAGRTYFVMFANPGRFVKKGSKLTVVIGDFQAENLVVQ